MCSGTGLLENFTRSLFKTAGVFDYAKINSLMEHYKTCKKNSKSHHTGLEF